MLTKGVILMKLRRILAILLALAMLCGIPTLAIAEESVAEKLEGAVIPSLAEEREPISNEAKVYSELLDYMYQASDNAIMTNTVGDHDFFPSDIHSEVPTEEMHITDDGCYIRSVFKDGKLHFEYYDEDFTLVPEKGWILDVEHKKFGGVYYGEKYNYIFSADGRDWALQQYDTDWQYIRTGRYSETIVKEALYAGSATFSEAGDTLFIHSCFKMPPNVWDGGSHQGCIVFIVDQEEMTWQMDYFQASHSFNQFVINDGTYLYTLDQSDAAPRGMYACRYKLFDYKNAEAFAESDYHICAGSWGDNDMGMYSGGFNFAGDRILTVLTSVDQEYAANNNLSNWQKNIYVYSHSKDLSEYKTVQLTHYEPKLTDLVAGWVNVSNPFLVPTDTEYSYVLWEEWQRDEGLRRVCIAKVDQYGNLIGDIHSVYGRLGCAQPVYRDGHIIWFETGYYYYGTYHTNNSPKFYKVNAEKLEAGSYDFDKYIDLADLEIELESTECEYDRYDYPEPKVKNFVLKDKGYQLVEDVDYHIKYENNYNVGEAYAVIIGNGPDFGGVFKGTVKVPFEVIEKDISDWTLKLDYDKRVFHPDAIDRPDYTIYDENGELVTYAEGDYSSVGVFTSFWAAGKKVLCFTIDTYGYTGTIYADYVIEPFPGEKLIIDMITEYNYTGNEIRPYVNVYYPAFEGNKRVEPGHQHGSKYYDNYSIRYEDNVNPGVGKVIIEFQGNYSGTVVKEFIIKVPGGAHTTHIGGTATCTEPAKCAICGEPYGKPAGHKAGKWEVTKKASLTENGLKEKKCTRCNKVLDSYETACFDDMKKGAWYEDAVRYVATNGLMNGVSGSEFGPDATTTRAMVVTVLYRMEGSPEVEGDTPFTDLKDAWYMAPVAWAYENQIVNGMNPTSFAPNGQITREQLATILHRYSDYKGYDVAGKEFTVSYPDVGKVSSWAKDALAWANAVGLVTGNNIGGVAHLDPQGKATRAQVATILMRFCENIANK